jgi:hypothetical protein
VPPAAPVFPFVFNVPDAPTAAAGIVTSSVPPKTEVDNANSFHAPPPPPAPPPLVVEERPEPPEPPPPIKMPRVIDPPDRIVGLVHVPDVVKMLM